jgi:hypothetical protein
MSARTRAALLALLVLLAALSGCGQVSETPTPAAAESSGVNNPEPVVESFFEDLGAALNDPQLAQTDRRAYWVEQLAGYFAPNERDDQRLALREALGSFAEDLTRLESGEALTIEMHGFAQGRKSLSDDGLRATVELPDATITMLITQASDRGPITIYEQPIALSQVIGSSDNSVPLVRIGGRWYLTEG